MVGLLRVFFQSVAFRSFLLESVVNNGSSLRFSKNFSLRYQPISRAPNQNLISFSIEAFDLDNIDCKRYESELSDIMQERSRWIDAVLHHPSPPLEVLMQLNRPSQILTACSRLGSRSYNHLPIV